MNGYHDDQIPVFAGPSLAGVVLEAPFTRLPPASAGDLLALIPGAARTVVLIDGVFGAQPAVWHKEVLVLLARGFRVIGAASMGALRAAELHAFGMIGVGAIFEAYASGRIVADDEVAVVHAPAALGGHALSLAQVDVRATLVAAVRAGAIEVGAARRLRELSGAMFYADRSWASVIARGREAELAVAGLEAWTQHGAVDLKRLDALAALSQARRLAPSLPQVAPEPPRTYFLQTLAQFAEIDLVSATSGRS